MAPESSSGSSARPESGPGSSEQRRDRSEHAAEAPRRDGRGRDDRSREELEESLDATREEIRRRIDSLREELALPRLRLKDRVRDHPELAVLAAGAAGVLAGRLVRGSGGGTTDEDPHRRLMARALLEAKRRAEDGTLDEEAIAEIAEAYGSALDRVAAGASRGGGLARGLFEEVGPLLLRRLAREGVDRILPALLEVFGSRSSEEGR